MLSVHITWGEDVMRWWDTSEIYCGKSLLRLKKEGSRVVGKAFTTGHRSDTYESRQGKRKDNTGITHIVELLWESWWRYPENGFSVKEEHTGQKGSIFSSPDMLSRCLAAAQKQYGLRLSPEENLKVYQLAAPSFPETVGSLEMILSWCTQG